MINPLLLAAFNERTMQNGFYVVAGGPDPVWCGEDARVILENIFA